jgi:hypothetical protein
LSVCIPGCYNAGVPYAKRVFLIARHLATLSRQARREWLTVRIERRVV